MEIIIHRVSNLKKLIKLPHSYGVEIDVRNMGKKLIVQHDPYENGELLEKYLKVYKHGTLILNIKSEQIEFKILKLLKKYKIKNYFFLDSSYPVIIKMIKRKIKNFAIRVSDFESFDNVFKIKKNARWIWLEIFKKIKISQKQINYLKKNNLKICLVSPELHNSPQDIKKIKKFLRINKILINAVCTKSRYKRYWQN